jgi:hypothetical protein
LLFRSFDTPDLPSTLFNQAAYFAAGSAYAHNLFGHDSMNAPLSTSTFAYSNATSSHASLLQHQS